MSLFECAPKRPLDYSGSAGLLWTLNGGRLVQLHRDWAVINVPVNRSERVLYRRNVDVAKHLAVAQAGLTSGGYTELKRPSLRRRGARHGARCDNDRGIG